VIPQRPERRSTVEERSIDQLRTSGGFSTAPCNPVVKAFASFLPARPRRLPVSEFKNADNIAMRQILRFTHP
jgi:hypothetical protein